MKKALTIFILLFVFALGIISYLYYLIDIEDVYIRIRYRILISNISFILGGTYLLFTSLWLNKYLYFFLNSSRIKQIDKTFHFYSSLVLSVLSFIIIPLSLYIGAKTQILGRISELNYNLQDDFSLLHFSVAFLTLLIISIIHFIIFMIGIINPNKIKFVQKRNVIIAFALSIAFSITTLYIAEFKLVDMFTSFFEDFIEPRFI
jgi:hypothetical protein